MKQGFKFQPILKGDNITLRPLVEADFNELYACASDKMLWAGHPDPDKYKKPVFTEMFDKTMQSGVCLVIADNLNSKAIGWTRYYLAETAPDDISIGFTFLSREYWGGKTNFELKKLMLDFAFTYFKAVWFHVSPLNIRSQKAVKKIGGNFTQEETLSITGKKQKWFTYKIERDDWLSNNEG